MSVTKLSLAGNSLIFSGHAARVWFVIYGLGKGKCQPFFTVYTLVFVQESGVKVNAAKFNYFAPEPLYSVISPLRALILRDSDNSRYLITYSTV
jgi:hypothetical protein